MKIKIGFFAVILFLSFFIFHLKFSFIVLLAIILHELGHIFMAKILKINFTECKIGIRGARLYAENMNMSYKNEILLAIGGPLANFLFSAIAYLVYQNVLYEEILYFIAVSLSLGVLNLLPAKDFDGERIIRSLLSLIFDAYLSDRISAILSFMTTFFMWCISVYFLMRSASNLSLFIFSVSLFFESVRDEIKKREDF